MITTGEQCVLIALERGNKEYLDELNLDIPAEIILNSFSSDKDATKSAIPNLIKGGYLVEEKGRQKITEAGKVHAQKHLEAFPRVPMSQTEKAIHQLLGKLANGGAIPKALAISELSAVPMSESEIYHALRNLWIRGAISPTKTGFALL